MKVKTSTLIYHALDWAVKKTLGDIGIVVMRDGKWLAHEDGKHHYSTDWAQGGPIIEREVIAIYKGEPTANRPDWHAYKWGKHAAESKGYGPTPLIAAMRCFVASKLGDEVDVPKELT